MIVSTGEGQQLDPRHLSHVVTGYVDAAAIAKKGSCHLFRHTMATLMLEGGSDTRFIQQMLGHESLESTQLYTQVSIRKLQEIYLATHPAAKLRPRGDASEEYAEVDRAELLSRLDVEDEADGEEP